MKRFAKNIMLPLFAVLLVVVLLIPVCATTEDAPADDVVSDAVDAVPPAEEVVPEAVTTSPTLVGRLMEFVDDNREEIIDITGFFGLLVASLLALFKQKKNGGMVLENVANMAQHTSSVAGSQQDVIGVVNELITAYNGFKQWFEENASTEEARNKMVSDLVAQNTAMLEILTTVYANSKNLPQGVKDIVTLKYAKCLGQIAGVSQPAESAEAATDECENDLEV